MAKRLARKEAGGLSAIEDPEEIGSVSPEGDEDTEKSETGASASSS